MSYTLALNTSTIRPASLMDKIRIAGEAGYDAIELWNDDLTAYVEKGGTLAEVRRALADNNLTVPSVIALHGWIDSQGDDYTKALDVAKFRMEQAAEVGAPHIVASPPRQIVDLDLAADRYTELLEIGSNFNIKPAMEFLGFVDGINDIRSAWQIVVDAGRPEGTIVLDPFHIFRGGSKLEDMEAIPGESIAIFHFNDAPDMPRETQTDADRVYPGDGILDLKAMLTILKKSGYQGTISLELFNPGLWEQDPLTVARTGLEKMRRVLESV